MNSQSQLKGMWWWTVVWLKMSRTFSERVKHEWAMRRDRGKNMHNSRVISISHPHSLCRTSLTWRKESIWSTALNRLFDSFTPFTFWGFWVLPGNFQFKRCFQFQMPIAQTEHSSSFFVRLCISWQMTYWIHFPSCQMELVIMWCSTQLACCPVEMRLKEYKLLAYITHKKRCGFFFIGYTCFNKNSTCDPQCWLLQMNVKCTAFKSRHL